MFPVELAWALWYGHEDVVCAPGAEPADETLAGLAVAVGGNDEGRGSVVLIDGLLDGVVHAMLYLEPVDLRALISGWVGVVHQIPFGEILERRQCSILGCGLGRIRGIVLNSALLGVGLFLWKEYRRLDVKGNMR